MQALAVPALAGAVVDRAHPVLHREREHRAAVMLRNWNVNEAVGLDQVARDARLFAYLALRHLDGDVVVALWTIQLRARALDGVENSACRERLALRVACVLGNHDLLHLRLLGSEDHGADDVGMSIAALLGSGLPGEVRLDGNLLALLEELAPSAHLLDAGRDHLGNVVAMHHYDARFLLLRQGRCRHCGRDRARRRCGGALLDEAATLNLLHGELLLVVLSFPSAKPSADVSSIANSDSARNARIELASAACTSS